MRSLRCDGYTVDITVLLLFGCRIHDVATYYVDICGHVGRYIGCLIYCCCCTADGVRVVVADICVGICYTLTVVCIIGIGVGYFTIAIVCCVIVAVANIAILVAPCVVIAMSVCCLLLLFVDTVGFMVDDVNEFVDLYAVAMIVRVYPAVIIMRVRIPIFIVCMPVMLIYVVMLLFAVDMCVLLYR